jgi:redox-sensing transcriptional repressor
MSRYRRLLTALHAAGTDNIYSHQLARHAVVSAPQVRRDLMAIGYSGSPNKGYDVAACIDSISCFLDGSVRQDVCLVGVGNLGRAVLAHFAEASPSVSIVAAFDTDPALRDTMVHGCRCCAADEIEQLVRDLGIEIAVLTVPGDAAQEVADTLVRAGVKSLISFAPTPLRIPNEIFVEYMDITAALESAAFFARLDARTNGNDENGEAELAPMVQKLGSLLARKTMRLEELAKDIGARIVTTGRKGGTEVTRIYAGDRVSDLLNEASDTTLLVSNLASVQMLRVAELMDVPGICFVGGIEPDDEVVELARSNGTLLMVSPVGVFETCGLIYRFLGGEEKGAAGGGAPGEAGQRGERTGG